MGQACHGRSFQHFAWIAILVIAVVVALTYVLYAVRDVRLFVITQDAGCIKQLDIGRDRYLVEKNGQKLMTNIGLEIAVDKNISIVEM